MKPLPLEDLGQQIQNLEAQLKSLRGEFQTRQGSLGVLQKRKKELQTQLQQVDSEIAAIVGGEIGNRAPAVTKTAKAAGAKKRGAGKAKRKKTKAKAAPKPQRLQAQPPLREYVTGILKQARKPLRTKELSDRVLAAGYETKSKNFPNVVQDLLKRMENIERVGSQGHQLKR